MKFSQLVSGISVLLLLSSCGMVKKAPVPVYNFEPGKPVVYKMALNGKLSLGMSLFKFSEHFTLNSDLYVTALETNSNGYKIRLELKNYQITGAEQMLSTLIENSINSFNSSCMTYYMSLSGKAINREEGKSDTILNSYTELLLPDISDIVQSGGKTNNYKSDFPARFEDRDLVVSHMIGWNIEESTADSYTLLDTVQYTAFAKEDFNGSDRSRPLGNLSIECEDLIHIFPGELLTKKGEFRVDFSISSGEGFMKSYYDLTGSGKFEMQKL